MWAQEIMYEMGGRDPQQEWAIFEVCPAHSKISAVSAAVFAAKGISQSSITACSRNFLCTGVVKFSVNLSLWCCVSKINYFI